MDRLIRSLTMLGALVAGQAYAHHSFSMFSMEKEKEVVLVGQVKELQWTNPHVWLQLTVPGADGKVVEWSIEAISPNVLARQGWTKRSLTPGQKVTVTVHPMRDGTPGGALIKVVLENGTVVGTE